MTIFELIVCYDRLGNLTFYITGGNKNEKT
ncbi:DUF4352 domain-containing protein, partial [Escherichia coli]